jgi:hypothetical protein
MEQYFLQFTETNKNISIYLQITKWLYYLTLQFDLVVFTREHGGINGLTPSEMFLQRLITSTTYTRTRQQSVTHVGN